ncbi:helix-turn-helix transcriptional regulator [Streptococcus agalactiae]|uniref:helix-turn-helix transcriptional regulator n=1 Tax=Streptococcus agalactiae TaxID=1311 RepID=UPI001374DAE9|nr:helix-turn-helix transcriptional regulator [Streptococcus agalactiae]KAF1153731.1 transcriptional regulator [Streptococcus agalactiae]KAF1158951.1 transcriptional regulator [Streptococcus agalactiae]
MKLKELRQAKGMTRVQLSKAIDVPVRTIARWENVESDMFLKTAIMLSTYFNVTLDEYNTIKK